MKQRIKEIDYLKCTFILLMIVFHLVYIGDKYPYAKQLVYTFHMPAFLIISGYLMNINKSLRAFLHTMVWIFIPYAIMESGYIVMSAILPVRERVEELSFGVWIEKLLLHPLGPYWYLHTLMVCGITYFAVDRLTRKSRDPLVLPIILSLIYAAESMRLDIVSLPNALYFAMGCVMQRYGLRFTSFFRPSVWSVIPFTILACFPENLNKSVPGGIAITYLAVSLTLTLFRLLPARMKTICAYIGSHTLVLLIFSPVFTITVKPLAGMFGFDPSGMLFLFTALAITVTGCFALAWVIDRLHLSPFFWGKQTMLQPFPGRNDKLTEK